VPSLRYKQVDTWKREFKKKLVRGRKGIRIFSSSKLMGDDRSTTLHLDEEMLKKEVKWRRYERRFVKKGGTHFHTPGK